MKASYRDVWFEDGAEIQGEQKQISFPFRKASARALIVRKQDGAILGTLHRQGARFALPGGQMESGETSDATLLRELAEEAISLIEPDPGWHTRVAVDYFSRYQELSIWHIIIVTNAEIGPCEENIESRWIQQTEDVWHPNLRELLLLMLHRHVPEMARLNLTLVG